MKSFTAKYRWALAASAIIVAVLVVFSYMMNVKKQRELAMYGEMCSTEGFLVGCVTSQLNYELQPKRASQVSDAVMAFELERLEMLANNNDYSRRALASNALVRVRDLLDRRDRARIRCGLTNNANGDGVVAPNGQRFK